MIISDEVELDPELGAREVSDDMSKRQQGRTRQGGKGSSYQGWRHWLNGKLGPEESSCSEESLFLCLRSSERVLSVGKNDGVFWGNCR